MPVLINATVDQAGEVNQLDAEKQIQVDLFWVKEGKAYACGTIVLTHNPQYPTPVITVVLAHPGIRFDVFNWKQELINTNKPREDPPQK